MKITLKDLAKKIGGNYWEKGSLKRVYLDRGYNTKKMSTKTFIWEKDNGVFFVSCRIDCPSQTYQWVVSQQDEIKEKVMEEIKEILSNEKN